MGKELQQLWCAECHEPFLSLSVARSGDKYIRKCSKCGKVNELAVVNKRIDDSLIFMVVGTL